MKKSFSLWRVAMIVVVIVAAGGGVAYYQGVLQPFGIYRPANSLMVIAPYKYAGLWVFDDAAVGLTREPFVKGVTVMIDEIVKDIPDAEKGFRMTFSTQPFPGYSHKLVWRRGDSTGNWYYCEALDQEGWLCPGLFKYYAKAPKEIYVQAEEK